MGGHRPWRPGIDLSCPGGVGPSRGNAPSCAGDHQEIGVGGHKRSKLLASGGRTHCKRKLSTGCGTLSERPGNLSAVGKNRAHRGKLQKPWPLARRHEYFDPAVKLLRKSVAAFEAVGNQEAVAFQTGNLGIVYEQRGELERAVETLERAVELFREVGTERSTEVYETTLAQLREKMTG